MEYGFDNIPVWDGPYLGLFLLLEDMKNKEHFALVGMVRDYFWQSCDSEWFQLPRGQENGHFHACLFHF